MSDGWIEYGGNGMPVDGNIFVCIRVRDGQETPAHWMTRASGWNWRWVDDRMSEAHKSGDILAYRIITDPEADLTP